MKTFAKILSLVLALCMMTGVVSAIAEGFTPAATYDPGERNFDGGEITTAEAEAGGGEVDTVAYAGAEGKDYTDEKEYTFYDYITATTTMDWNPHTWGTSDDSSVLDMMTMGFYGIVLNEDATGYSIVCEMAAALPEDVTAEYVGKFGVEEGETAKAWRIALNQDATWENGEKITADDYVYSMQQQLNPKMKNRRADSYYAGDMIIYNAKNYLYAGETAYSLIEDTAENLLAAGTDVYLDMGFWGVAGAPDAEGNAAPQYVNINDDTMYRDEAVAEGEAEDWVSAKYLFDNYLAAGTPYESYASSYLYTASIAPETEWEDVGLVKVDDYTIDLVLEKAVEEPSFYMPYNLSSNWLVYKPMYEELKVFTDADGKEVATEEEAAVVTSKYMKDVESSISYGPYKISYFELDKQISFERNEEWYGYRDGKHAGQYQADNYSITVISDHATQMMAFEAGQVDSVSLQSDDMEKYASSAYITYEPQSYTTKVSFNTNYEKLLERGTGSQILVIDEFREAFALAIDRQHFATAYTAAGTAGFGLLNYQYVYNPFTGEAYRDSEGAKDAMVSLYGLSYGEGSDYATLDEAYDAMTGYLTKSMLVVPLRNDRDKILGVMQLINAMDGTGAVVPFDPEVELLVSAIASQAAISITNMQYSEQITSLLDSLVGALTTAIDERSPYNANHTRNMALVGEAFLDYMDRVGHPRRFDEDTRRAFLMAIRLHDVGKLAVPPEVMDKENRLVGMKSHGLYETPGGTILCTAHSELEFVTCDRETMHFKDQVAPKYAELVYNGLWFSPLTQSLNKFFDETNKWVTGSIKLKLYKGNIMIAGRKPKYNLYNENFASFGDVSLYDHKDATGFISCFSLPGKVIAMMKKETGLA